MKACNSCQKATENDVSAVSFSCPVCDSEIARCGACRKTAVGYKCTCGLEGP